MIQFHGYQQVRSARRPRPSGQRPDGEKGRSSGPAHLPCFDGLRAFAALTVIGVHTTFASGFTGRSGLGRYTSRLEIGVQVFFVISGFLLYRPFAAAHFGGRPAPGFRNFWTRRLKRIIPAYWLAFLVITYVLHADTVRHTWFAPLVYLGFAQIYLPHYALSGITQAWSLCTEMTFYLMVPLWGAFIGRRRRTTDGQLRVELVGLAGLVLVSLAFRIPVLSAHSQLASTMPQWLPAYLDQFALGMLLAVLSTWLEAEQRRPAWLWHPLLPWASWATAGLAFVAVSNIGLPWTPITASPVGPSLLRQTLYGLFAFCMVLPAVFGPQDRGLVRRLLRFRPLALIGVVSYGIYLWHQAWMNLWFTWTGDRLFAVNLPALVGMVTALALVSATASYLLVERPILRRRRSAASLRSPVSGPPASASPTGLQAASGGPSTAVLGTAT